MQVAGFEWGSGFYINPTPPEEAAQVPARDRVSLMRILHVASEVAPYSKTGGLADVLGALPRALAALGHEVTVVTPRYRVDRSRALRPGAAAARAGDAARRRHRRCRRLRRAGGRRRRGCASTSSITSRRSIATGIYGDAEGDYADNARRFALLGSAALALAAEFGAWPDVVHGHDWQAGPAMLFAKRRWGDLPPPKTVFTLHNLAFQGLFPEQRHRRAGIAARILQPRGLRILRAGVSYLKAGLALADGLSTVSPRYAQEIQTPEQGLGIDGFCARAARCCTGS